MFENLVVIGRMNERIDLLREEVERRGMRWADAEVEDKQKDMTNGDGVMVNGDGPRSSQPSQEARAPSGRLTDEELMRRLQERMGEEDGEEGEEGLHL